jgi:hypothetical protein
MPLSYLCVNDDAIDVYARRQDLVSVMLKSGSAGPGPAVTDLSLPHPPGRPGGGEVPLSYLYVNDDAIDVCAGR